LRCDVKSRIVKSKGVNILACEVSGMNQTGTKSPWDESFKGYKLLG
jgi:hypothetical protein